MGGLVEHIIASENDDIPRFIKFFERMFKERKLKKTKKFTQTKDEIRKLEDEVDDAKKKNEKIKKANKSDAKGMTDLQS